MPDDDIVDLAGITRELRSVNEQLRSLLERWAGQPDPALPGYREQTTRLLADTRTLLDQLRGQA